METTRCKSGTQGVAASKKDQFRISIYVSSAALGVPVLVPFRQHNSQFSRFSFRKATGASAHDVNNADSLGQHSRHRQQTANFSPVFNKFNSTAF